MKANLGHSSSSQNSYDSSIEEEAENPDYVEARNLFISCNVDVVLWMSVCVFSIHSIPHCSIQLQYGMTKGLFPSFFPLRLHSEVDASRNIRVLWFPLHTQRAHGAGYVLHMICIYYPCLCTTQTCSSYVIEVLQLF
jgi:hypothetical protein